MKPRCPEWVAAWQYGVPHLLGLVLVGGVCLCGLGQSNAEDVRAVAGAVGVWLAESLALIGYFALRYSLLQDPDGFGVKSQATAKRRRSLFAVALNTCPGIWIGMVALNPMAAVIGTRLAISLILLLNKLRLAQLEQKLAQLEQKSFEPQRFNWNQSLIDLVLMCAGAVLGRILWLWSA